MQCFSRWNSPGGIVAARRRRVKPWRAGLRPRKGGKGPPIPPRWTFARLADRSARAQCCVRGLTRLAAGRGPPRPAGKSGTASRKNGRHSIGPRPAWQPGRRPPVCPRSWPDCRRTGPMPAGRCR
jgi:hypothetical protein